MKDTQLNSVSVCLTSPLVITELEASWNPRLTSVVLYPSHTAMEPNLGLHTSEFGKRFGIHFYDSNDRWYARPISSLEFLRCYGVHPNLLDNPHIWLGMDVILDQLLPGCLPIKLV